MRTLVYSPDPRLEKMCKEVESFDLSLLELCEDMINVLFKHDGYSISAPQVGEPLRIISFMDLTTIEQYPKAPRILINPIIYDYSKNYIEEWESSLSLPGLNVKISRPIWVDVYAQDEYGNDFEERFEFLSARLIQNQLNQLDGISISKYQNHNNSKYLIQ